MKRSFIYFLFLICTINASGQQTGLTIGLEGGIKIFTPVFVYDTSGTSPANIIPDVPNAILTGGPFLLYTLNQRISFKLGAMYSGDKLRSILTNYPPNNPYPGLHFDKRYVSGWDFPILMRISYGKGIRGFLDIGPSLNLVNERYESFFRDSSQKSLLAETYRSTYLNFGFCFGMGISYKLKENVFLNLEGFYQLKSAPSTWKGGIIGEFNVFAGIGYQFWVTEQSGDDKGDIFYRFH